MKLSIVYGPNYRRRAALASEDGSDSYPHARFFPAHRQTWESAGERKSREVPDSIHVSSWSYRVKRGRIEARSAGEFKSPKVLPAEYVERIHKIDLAMEKLRALRHELQEEGAMRGRELRVDDCAGGGA